MVFEHFHFAGLCYVEANPLRHFLRARVEGIQTRHSAHPSCPAGLIGRSHHRTAQTRRISRIVRVMAQRPARRIQPMQAGLSRRHTIPARSWLMCQTCPWTLRGPLRSIA